MYVLCNWNLIEDEERLDIVHNTLQFEESSATVSMEVEEVEDSNNWTKAAVRIQKIESNSNLLIALGQVPQIKELRGHPPFHEGVEQ